MQSLPSLHTKDSTLSSSLPNLPLSWPPPYPSMHLQHLLCPLSLQFHFLLLAILPSSTGSNTGWGSLDVSNMPTFPTHDLESSVAQSMNPSPILSINIPIHAHCLCEGSLEGHHLDTMCFPLHSPHINCALKFYLDVYFSLWSITCIYL